ncbi:MAG: hypothetical protein U1E36_09770 [Rickettsiales bacterium]
MVSEQLPAEPKAENESALPPLSEPANNASYIPSSGPMTQGVPGGTTSNQNQPSQNQNPMHTSVTRDPASTPGYFRLVLPLLAGRYLWRGLLSSLQEKQSDFFGVFSKTKKNMGDAIEGYLAKSPTTSHEDIIYKLREAGWTKHGAEEALKEVKDNQALVNSTEFPLETKEATIKFSDAQDKVRKFSSEAKKRVVTRKYESAFDGGIGIASTGITLNYMSRVKTDIHNVFAETVALEKGRDPRDINYSDIKKSDNLIVQSTLSNSFRNNVFRLANDALFFVRPLSFALTKPLVWSRSWYTGEMAIGLKGVYLLKEVMRKETTIFEDLIQLIDRKFNPIKGIGDPISQSDVIDLYQKFAMVHTPEAAFTDATIRQNKDGLNWEKSYAIFSRVTELMNNTYKYKHMTHGEETQDDFALPKFLYLLGHKMIDPYKPEETLAYVEIANKYGIEPVKQMRAALSHGASLESVLEKYPVSLERLTVKKSRGAETPTVPVSFFPAKEESMPQPANESKPQTKIAVSTLAHEAPAPSGPSLTQG